MPTTTTAAGHEQRIALRYAPQRTARDEHDADGDDAVDPPVAQVAARQATKRFRSQEHEREGLGDGREGKQDGHEQTDAAFVAQKQFQGRQGQGDDGEARCQEAAYLFWEGGE